MQRLHNTLHRLPFISQELINTVDWAWLIDFGQGNFNEAKAAIDTALLQQKTINNLLARAIVHQLQGEYSQALILLQEAFSMQPDHEQSFVIATITYLVKRKMLDNLADGFSWSAVPTANDKAWQQQMQVLRQKNPTLTYRLEINLIQQIASILPCWRTIILQQQKLEEPQKYQSLIWQKLTEQLEIYQQQKYYAIADFFYCYFADLLALSRKFKAGWQLIENLAFAYRNSQKYLETAWYLMCQGDLIVETAPFGKAIVFGYRLTTNYLDFDTIQSLNRSQIDHVSAQQKYLEARQYFHQAAAPRGEAMSIMRLAYINGIQQQWHLAACGYEEAEKTFLQTGDILNALAAKMGYLWSCLQYEALEAELLANLQKSADWMFKNQTFVYSMSWAIAFTAAAQEALFQEQGIVISQRLIQVSKIMVTKAVNSKLIFDSISCIQLWTNCLSTIRDYYRNLVTSFISQNDWVQAFIAAEKSKIYNLYSQIKDDNLTQSLTNRLNQIFSIDKVAALLPSDTVLISFLVSPNQLLGWAVTSQGLVNNSILDRIESEEFAADNLEQTINIWLNSLIDSESDTELNKILEHIFFESFKSEIENHKHILLVSCESLQKLSFAGLKYYYKSNNSILKKSNLLIEDKTVSYFSSICQIACCQPLKIKINQVLIYTDEAELPNKPFGKQAVNFSIAESLSAAIAKIHQSSDAQNQSEQSITDVTNDKPLVHLFLTKSLNLVEKIVQKKVTDNLIIINLENFKKTSLISRKINSLAQSILDKNVQTAVIIFDGENSLATAILTSLFHQGLYFGQSVAESLQQAQKQLRLITAQEALDFCHYLQSNIPWQQPKDRASRALITKHIGDIMVLGKDYKRAAEAYQVAIAILHDTGYFDKALSLENNYKMLKSLKKISQPFQSQRLIFNAPAYWNNAYIYGNWQLSLIVS